MTNSTAASVLDPTTASIEAANAESDRLRGEVLRLSQALVAAYTDNETISAERDRFCAEADRLKFVEGYDQAVEDIRDHFRKAKETDVVAKIEKIWMKDKLS